MTRCGEKDNGMTNPDYIRFGAFAAMFAVMASWEMLAPRRPLTTSKALRWSGNLGVLAIDTFLVRLLFTVLPMAMAQRVQVAGWGILNDLPFPYWLKVVAGIMLLDLAIYLQHVMFHATPVFWRLHMMHHADVDFDFTTGLRFHPIEILLSMIIKLATVVIIGPPPLATLLFEVFLNATSMFNHGNVRLPPAADRVIRLIVVTPEMHRVHNSVIPRETNSNFGFNFPWWDRIAGTYRDQPKAGHVGMTIGLKQFQGVRRQTLWWMLALPFRGRTGQYPTSRGGAGS
jgi:sterol desaturase/sphingolipid hydroxylase (fatty acid hydroxylase superfamily)